MARIGLLNLRDLTRFISTDKKMSSASADTLSATDSPTDASAKPRRRDLQEVQRRALESILAALASGVRSILLTGARGSGQSSILDVAAAAIETETTQVLRVDPGGAGKSDPRLLCLILGGSDSPGASNAIKQAQLLLLYPPAPKTRTVLLIDNAHLLERHALVQLHLTSALQAKDTAQLQIVFAVETTSESSLNPALLRQLEGSDGVRVRLESQPPHSQHPPPPRGADFRYAIRPTADFSGGERASKPAPAFARAGSFNPFASPKPPSEPPRAADGKSQTAAGSEKPPHSVRANSDTRPVDFRAKPASERKPAPSAFAVPHASVPEQPPEPREPDLRAASPTSSGIPGGESASTPAPAFAKAGAADAFARGRPSSEPRSPAGDESQTAGPIEKPPVFMQAAPAARSVHGSVPEASSQPAQLYTPSEFSDSPAATGTRPARLLIWAGLVAAIAIAVPLSFLLRHSNVRTEPGPTPGSQIHTHTTTASGEGNGGLPGSRTMSQPGGSEATRRNRSPEGSGPAMAASSEVSIPLPRLPGGPTSPSAMTPSGSAVPPESRAGPSVPAASTGVRPPPEPPNLAPVEGKYAAGPAWPGAPLRGGQPLYWGPAATPSPAATGQPGPATTIAPAPASSGAAAAIGTAAPLLGDSPALVEWLITWGDDAWRLGDIANARSLYARAAAAGSGRAAIAIGRTFDPRFVATIHTRRIDPDPASAIAWYKRAASLGDPDASRLLAGLVAGAPH